MNTRKRSLSNLDLRTTLLVVLSFLVLAPAGALGAIRLPAVELDPDEGLRVSVSAPRGGGCIGGLELIDTESGLSLHPGLSVDSTGGEVDVALVVPRSSATAGQATRVAASFLDDDASHDCSFRLEIVDDRGASRAAMSFESGAGRFMGSFVDVATLDLYEEIAYELDEARALRHDLADLRAAGTNVAASLPIVGALLRATDALLDAIEALLAELAAQGLEREAQEIEDEAGATCFRCPDADR